MEKENKPLTERMAGVVAGIMVLVVTVGTFTSVKIDNERFDKLEEAIIKSDRVFFSRIKKNNPYQLPEGVVFENRRNQYIDFYDDGKLDKVIIYAPGVYDGSNVVRDTSVKKFDDEFEKIKAKYAEQNRMNYILFPANIFSLNPSKSSRK